MNPTNPSSNTSRRPSRVAIAQGCHPCSRGLTKRLAKTRFSPVVLTSTADDKFDAGMPFYDGTPSSPDRRHNCPANGPKFHSLTLRHH
jgi:hypothetical protein